MKKQILLLLLIPFSVLSIPYHKKKMRNPGSDQRLLPMINKKRVNVTTFCLQVQGVECAFCAQSILALLHKIDGIEEPLFKNYQADFSESFVEFFWMKKNENFAFDALKKMIEKEGYELASLKGVFYGSIEHKDNQEKPLLQLQGLGLLVPVDQMPTGATKKKILSLRGKISLDDKGEYIFTYLG